MRLDQSDALRSALRTRERMSVSTPLAPKWTRSKATR
jgi:hypothetical protein